MVSVGIGLAGGVVVVVVDGSGVVVVVVVVVRSGAVVVVVVVVRSGADVVVVDVVVLAAVVEVVDGVVVEGLFHLEVRSGGGAGGNGTGGTPARAGPMNSDHTCAGHLPPVTERAVAGGTIGVAASGNPTHTAVASRGVYPMNQASPWFCVVPVFPATGRSMRARRPVPRWTTCRSTWVARRATSGDSRCSTSGSAR